ncbi:MAG: hypothetical protein KC910_05215 [Candidatus Eremiobacteraeota bacterium]|nr:hypothetical protein [Candidatus Eremiobacteraeota bacterium]
MDPLEQLLQARRAEGAFDSSGDFTIELSRARAKLARFQLADPDYFVLKLLQAAVAGGATLGSFRFRLSYLRFLFALPDDSVLFDQDRLFEALALPGLCPPGAIRHLAISVTAGLTTHPVRVVWSTWRRGQLQQLEFDFKEPRGFVSSQRPNWASYDSCCYFRIERNLARSGFVIDPSRARRVIAQRCRFFPMSLELEGEPYVPLGPGGWLDGQDCLLQLVSPGGGLRLRGRAGGRQVEPGLFVGGRKFFSEICPAERWENCDLAVWLPLEPKGSSVFRLVNHGVSMDPVRFDTTPNGMLVVGDGTGLKTDLSEMGWAVDEAWQAYAREVEARVEEGLARLEPHLDGLARWGRLLPFANIDRVERVRQRFYGRPD